MLELGRVGFCAQRGPEVANKLFPPCRCKTGIYNTLQQPRSITPSTGGKNRSPVSLRENRKSVPLFYYSGASLNQRRTWIFFAGLTLRFILYCFASKALSNAAFMVLGTFFSIAFTRRRA